jgi:superfamily II DNA or RNA helicase
MMTLNLRDYQQDATDAITEAHDRGVRSVAVVMATGAGKTHVIADQAEKHHAKGGKHRRTLILAHRAELIEQAAGRVRDTGSKLRVGVVQGTINQCAADVVVGSVQTLRREARRDLVRDVGLVIVDECHHATAESYRAILGHYGCLPGMNGPAKAAGFTATMMRSDKGQLGDIWPEVPYSITMSDLIARGFLVPPDPYWIRVAGLDLSRVKLTAGDYQSKALGEALHDSLAPAAVIRAYRKHAEGRRALCFTPTVTLAEEMCEHFTAAGLRSEMVSDKTPKILRRNILRRYRAGELDMICNCGILTEGTDLPNVGCVIMMRPTKSQSLFIQIVGRGARVDPNDPAKKDFIFLDVCGASQHHTLSASIELFGEPVFLKPKKDDDEEFEETMEDPNEKPEREGADGKLSSEKIDLFAVSKPGWRQTRLGSWFLPAPRNHFLAAVPSTKLGAIDLIDIGPSVGDSMMLSEGTTLTEAMRMAESTLDKSALSRVDENAGWRSTEPTRRDLALARAFGIRTDGVSAGQLKDQLVIAQATRRIDPCTIRRLRSIELYTSPSRV